MRLPKFLAPFQDRRKINELFVGLVLVVVMSCIAYGRLLDPFEALFLDFRFLLRGEKNFPQNISIIGIDEASLDAFGRWPWPRSRHANLLDLLRNPSFRPDFVAYDILFENSNPGDEALVHQAKNLEGRYLTSYFFEKGPLSIYEKDEAKEKRLEDFALPPSTTFPEEIEGYNKVSLPFLELEKASSAAFVNTPIDADGRTRRAQLLGRFQGKIYPSMDLLTVLHVWGARIQDVHLEKRAIVIEKSKAGRKVIPVTARGDLLINFYSGSDRIAYHSFLQVLQSGKAWIEGEEPEILKSLKDKIVLVGVTALGIGDRRVTPFRLYEPGVSLHAQAIASILNGNFLTRAPAQASYAVFILVSLITIFISMFERITKSLPALISLGVLYFLIAHLFFLRGVWMDVAVHELNLVVLFIGITSFRYFTASEELKRTHEQLLQSTKMASLGQLSAGIAHEFRNILHAINLHVEYCSQPDLPAANIPKYMEGIKRIMENANLVLNGLLTFARKSESVKQVGNLKKTVEDTLLLEEKEMLRHQIEIKTELEEVPEISFDAGQISQVMMNLMNNARDALKDRENKEIVIRLKDAGNDVKLEIADNGTGIPPQVLKRLFEPFVTSKPAGKGTGLGLSVCHGIIRNHGGDITATTQQGKGTTWHIVLPKT